MLSPEEQAFLRSFRIPSDRGTYFTPGSLKAVPKIPGFIEGLKQSQSFREKLKFEPKSTGPTCVISGSFRFKDKIDQMIDQLTKGGVQVLAPKKGQVVEVREEIKMLEGDDLSEPLDPSANFIHQITRADALYVYARKGYIGKQTRLEIMLTTLFGVSIFTLEPIKPRNLTSHIEDREFRARILTKTPADFMEMLVSGNIENQGQWWVRPKEERLAARVLPFTDHTGERALFIDIAEMP